MPLSSGLFIDDCGEGPAVALLHGSPTATRAFAGLVEALRPTHRVLLPEMPGYGRSPAVELGAPLARSQERLEEALLSRGVREVALVGFSLGGYRALDLALRRRLRVTSIVTIGGYAALPPAHQQALRTLASQLRAMANFTDPAFRRSIALLMVSPGFAARRPAVLEEIEGWLDVVSPVTLADELAAAADAPDLLAQLGKLSVPLLALCGELDGAIPVAYSEALVAAVPGARLQLFAGCGHTLMLEVPGQTAEAIATALESGER